MTSKATFQCARHLLTFVEVPEEEEFAPTCSGGADVTEQVNARVPEHAVKAQHHLLQINKREEHNKERTIKDPVL